MSASVAVDIDGRQLSLSNLNKVLYPATGFTKAQVIDYYTRIAPVLLPHIHDLPMTLKRYPNGVDATFFFEKNCPSHRPPWVATAPVWSDSNKRELQFCLVNDLSTLIWVANLASLELHPNLAFAQSIEQPRWMVFDLDPGAPAALKECAAVALVLRGLFEQMGLQSFAKTSGSKGMQLYVPLNTPTTYDVTKSFSLSVAQSLEGRPELRVVSNMKKELRRGKVLVDWSQNDEHKTTVAVYSLRAKERPTVSTPVTWDEVEACAAGQPLVFETEDTLARVDRHGDLFAPLLTLQQALPSVS